MRLTVYTGIAVAATVFGVVTFSAQRADAADPCSMLSADKVAAALGVPEVKTPGGTNRCVWTPKKYAPGSKSVTLQLMDYKGGAKGLANQS